ncbi:MAG: polymerase delta prime subunit [Pseudomonadota bacterium]
MLHAETDSGAEALLDDLCQGLLCDQPESNGFACGQCNSCAGIAHQGVHPDLLVLVPEETEEAEEDAEKKEKDKALKKRQIKVEDARRALAFVSLSANSQRGKLVVIKPADTMNREAANALLKMLEEPPQGTRWLLLTYQPLRLPATVRSRCLQIKVPSATAEQAMDFLIEQYADRAELLLARGGGLPFAALAYADIQAMAEEFLQHLGEPRKLSAISLGEQLAALGRAEQRKRLEIYLKVLSHFLVDCALQQRGLAARFHPDFPTPVKQVLPQIPPLQVLRLYQDTRLALAGIEHPLQARLVLERLLLNYKQIFSPSVPVRKRDRHE